MALLIALLLVTSWSYRNKIWYGLPYALKYYLLIRRLRREIKDAYFQSEYEFANHLVILPKIKIIFDNNYFRTSGKVFIKSSIKFDSKLEDLRIDSALKGYVSERQYLSQDRNWYIYEFIDLKSNNQIEIKSVNELVDWSSKTTDDYALRLDERTTVPFHI